MAQEKNICEFWLYGKPSTGKVVFHESSPIPEETSEENEDVSEVK